MARPMRSPMYGWEGDVVWLKTPDQACKRVRDADDEMRQVLQTQYEQAGLASSLNSACHPCCGPCFFHHTRPHWAANPKPLWFPRPGLPRKSGVPAAGIHCRTSLLRCGRGRGLPGPLSPWHCPGRFGRGKPLPYASNPRELAIYMAFPDQKASLREGGGMA